MRLLRDRGLDRVLELCELRAEPSRLVEVSQAHDALVLVDTIRSGAPAGIVRRFDVSVARLPTRLRASSSTHAVGLDDAIELARALGRLPRA